jgi:hypothetical protein
LGEVLYREGATAEGKLLMENSCRFLKGERKAAFRAKAEATDRLRAFTNQTC